MPRFSEKKRTERLNRELLEHDFRFSSKHVSAYEKAKTVAEHYAMAENAMAILSNMACNTSYICYGHLGQMFKIGNENEEVDSIWEKKLLDRVHKDDMAEKIALELQFLTFIQNQPVDTRRDYYLQHFLRVRDSEGNYQVLRHRIFYLDYDSEGNVLLTLCLYSASNQNQGVTGIINSLHDTLVSEQNVCIQGILSKRECEILEHLGRGMASKQISDILCISTNTVNNHRQNILHKLQCQNTTEAVSVAKRLGLLTSN